MPQRGVGSMEGKNTGNMPSAMCASSINNPLLHSNKDVKFCTRCLCMKMSSVCLFAHGQCRVYYIYHVEFHFRCEHLITFPV